MPFLSFPTKNKKIIKSYNIKSDINGRTRTKIAEIKILVSIKIIPKVKNALKVVIAMNVVTWNLFYNNNHQRNKLKSEN